MKKAIIALVTATALLLTALLLSACELFGGKPIDEGISVSYIDSNGMWVEKCYVYLSFEEVLAKCTDVVVAQYVGCRAFGETLTEYEFTVQDRVLGNAADRIYVYEENAFVAAVRSSVSDSDTYDDEEQGSEDMSGLVNDAVDQQEDDAVDSDTDVEVPPGFSDGARVDNGDGILSFDSNTSYLLVLEKLWGAELKTNEDGYLFMGSLIINLDNPTESRMYEEPLSMHSSKLDFESRDLTRNKIISFVREETENNPPAREHIRSTNIDDVIAGSPYVLVVEINEPDSLMSDTGQSDYMDTDIYYCTVVETLKGDVEPGFKFIMVFFADTVKTGDRWIIAAERVTEGDDILPPLMFTMTSKNSVFPLNRTDEITQIAQAQASQAD